MSREAQFITQDNDAAVVALVSSNRQLAERLRLLELRMLILEEMVARLKVSVIEEEREARR